ncbi:MAG: tRNA (cytidine(34)-2'-O)-methyltransferase [bacterium]|nr:tRNA (cytidine(34)-2'-O)-methyltransferase [bacterium]
MFQVVLYQPEIPPNTGNIIRLCANTGADLHLVRPLGFSMEDTRLRRAGLDYHEYASVSEHSDLDAYLEAARPARLFAMSGGGRQRYSEVAYREGDGLLFGPESVGLGERILGHEGVTEILRIPMLPDRRSLNLSNAVAVVLFEAWRQLAFGGGV